MVFCYEITSCQWFFHSLGVHWMEILLLNKTDQSIFLHISASGCRLSGLIRTYLCLKLKSSDFNARTSEIRQHKQCVKVTATKSHVGPTFNTCFLHLFHVEPGNVDAWPKRFAGFFGVCFLFFFVTCLRSFFFFLFLGEHRAGMALLGS